MTPARVCFILDPLHHTLIAALMKQSSAPSQLQSTPGSKNNARASASALIRDVSRHPIHYLLIAFIDSSFAIGTLVGCVGRGDVPSPPSSHEYVSRLHYSPVPLARSSSSDSPISRLNCKHLWILSCTGDRLRRFGILDEAVYPMRVPSSLLVVPLAAFPSIASSLKSFRWIFVFHSTFDVIPRTQTVPVLYSQSCFFTHTTAHS